MRDAEARLPDAIGQAIPSLAGEKNLDPLALSRMLAEFRDNGLPPDLVRMWQDSGLEPGMLDTLKRAGLKLFASRVPEPLGAYLERVVTFLAVFVSQTGDRF